MDSSFVLRLEYYNFQCFFRVNPIIFIRFMPDICNSKRLIKWCEVETYCFSKLNPAILFLFFNLLHTERFCRSTSDLHFGLSMHLNCTKHDTMHLLMKIR
jgi:hypothetical protein